MLIQHDKATTAAFRPGQAFSGNRKSIVTNGDASKGLTGWTIISGDAQVVNGAFRVASTATEGGNLAQAIGRKLKPGKDYRPITSQEIAITSVFAIEIEAWSGKEKVAPE